MRVLRFLLYTLLALVAWTSILAAGAYEGWWHRPLARSGDTRAFMDAAIAELDKPERGNTAFVLIENGKVVREHFRSTGTPVDRNTLFQTATMSQWLTAWGVMTLVEAGKIDLDAPASRYFTRWSLPDSKFDNNGVTVRRLLSHNAGLMDGLKYRGFRPDERMQSIPDSLTRAADALPSPSLEAGIVRVGVQPGEQLQMSGGGFTLLQLIVEEVSGQSFNDYMRTAVFVPLGMTRSTHSLNPGIANIAEIYDTLGQTATHRRFTALAASSLYTSAADMTRFIQAQVTGPNGEPTGRGVLTPKSLEEMRRPHASLIKVVVLGLGTGLYTSNNAGGLVIGYDGFNEPAINSAARVDPKTGNGLVILETGAPISATTVAGEWAFWQTGNRDYTVLAVEISDLLKVLTAGWIGIPVMALILFFVSRRLAN